MRSLGFCGMAALAVLTIAVSSPDASAAFKLRLTEGVFIEIVEDGGVGDAFPGAGTVEFSGPIGSFQVAISVGLSKPTVGPGRIELTSVNVSSELGGTIMIELTDTDFFEPSTAVGLSLITAGTTAGEVNVTTFADATNTEFGTGQAGPSLGPLFGASFGEDASLGFAPIPSPYSLTTVAVVTHPGTSGGPKSTNLTSTLSVVSIPEPATGLVFGIYVMCSLCFYGLVRRRK